MLKTLLIGLILGITIHGYGQTETDSPPHFVVFVVDGIQTTEECRTIDFHMRRTENITLSRMDIPTRRYYAVFNAQAEFDEQWFSEKFAELGNYTVHCYFQGVHGTDKFQPVSKETCSELN